MPSDKSPIGGTRQALARKYEKVTASVSVGLSDTLSILATHCTPEFDAWLVGEGVADRLITEAVTEERREGADVLSALGMWHRWATRLTREHSYEFIMAVQAGDFDAAGAIANGTDQP